MPIVIRNGRVIDPSSNTDRVADVLIVDGRIAGVAPNLSSVKAEVFDASGRRVTTLLDSEVGAGAHSVRWEGMDDGGRRVRPGLYLCRLDAAGERHTAKLMMLR